MSFKLRVIKSADGCTQQFLIEQNRKCQVALHVYKCNYCFMKLCFCVCVCTWLQLYVVYFLLKIMVKTFESLTVFFFLWLCLAILKYE